MIQYNKKLVIDNEHRMETVDPKIKRLIMSYNEDTMLEIVAFNKGGDGIVTN